MGQPAPALPPSRLTSGETSKPRATEVVLKHASHIDHHDVTVRVEPPVGTQLASADLKLQLSCNTIAITCSTALAYIGRVLGEGPNQREHGRPCPAHTLSATPLEIEDVRARAVGVGAGQRKRLVPLTPGLDVRQEMDLGPLSDPVGLSERCD